MTTSHTNTMRKEFHFMDENVMATKINNFLLDPKDVVDEHGSHFLLALSLGSGEHQHMHLKAGNKKARSKGLTITL